MDHRLICPFGRSTFLAHCRKQLNVIADHHNSIVSASRPENSRNRYKIEYAKRRRASVASLSVLPVYRRIARCSSAAPQLQAMAPYKIPVKRSANGSKEAAASIAL